MGGVGSGAHLVTRGSFDVSCLRAFFFSCLPVVSVCCLFAVFCRLFASMLF